MNRSLIACAIALALVGCDASVQVVQTPALAVVTPVAPVNAGLVAFMGDSITYHWDDATWIPASDMLSAHLPSFIDAGISGQVTSQMLARFDTDITDKHPQVIVIDGGTNDAGTLQSGDTSSLFAMVEDAIASGAYVIVGTLPPDDYTSMDAYTQTLHMQWNDAIRNGASAYGYVVADYYSVMINADGSQNQAMFKPDRVHPNGDGFAAMWNVLFPLLPSTTGAH